MKASRKEKDVFVPVFLELETQEEVDTLVEILGMEYTVSKAIGGVNESKIKKLCERSYQLLSKYL